MTREEIKDMHDAEMQGSEAYELKPCPFCGGTNITKATNIIKDDGRNAGWLVCANCEAEGPYSPAPYAANLTIEQAWNTRADLAPDRAAFEQMREALEAMLHRHIIYCGGEGLPFAGHTDEKLSDLARAALKAAEESK